ncbi:MAG: zinc-ribbon domain-containing protein [Anaerolineales bacterium]|nr:zinc-ribbon domain-containing protein [Anaerolineales bacterium]
MMAPVRQRRQRKSRHTLFIQKNELLEQIRLLDFDHETGKLPTDVYEVQRQALVEETAVLLKKLDAAPVSNSKVAKLDTKIETAVAQMRGQPLVAVTAAAAATHGDALPRGRFCSQCGNPIDQADKFCSTCGHKLV